MASMLAFAVGCSTMPGEQRTAPSPTSQVAAVAPSTPSSTIPRMASGAGGDERGESRMPEGVNAEGAALQEALRTADAAGPFGDADLWIGAGPPPAGLQRSLGPGDLPGPFWKLISAGPGSRPHIQSWARTFDQCWEVDHDGNGVGGDYRTLRYLGMLSPDGFHRPRCGGGRFLAQYIGPWSHGAESFPTSESAQSWLDSRRVLDERVRRRAVGIGPNAFGVGFTDSWSDGLGDPAGIAFARPAVRTDDVRVLPGSLGVNDGVLRGLVRNWSRHLWAYGVIVTAEDRRFLWPLSVQPGETAPFEIPGWDGPIRLEQITVDADLSWHPDLSRAFGSEAWRSSLHHLLIENDSFFGRVPVLDPKLRERFPEVTADVEADLKRYTVVDWFDIELRTPPSHPSLRYDLEHAAVDDLRAYGVVFDGIGRVVDLGPAEITGRTFIDDDQHGTIPEYFELTRWPPPRLSEHPSLSISFDVFVELKPVGDDRDASQCQYVTNALHINSDYAQQHWTSFCGGFIFWIGAAHPFRPAG